MKTIIQFFQNKKNIEKISIVTCYDASFSKIISYSNIDSILVGDSLGMVVQGHDSTLPVTLDEMIYHTKSVKRGCNNKYIITDLPFLSYQTSLEVALTSAGKVMKETGADAVKIEGGGHRNLEVIRTLTEMGIPVMGHLGLTPQSFQVLGGYKVQGKDPEHAEKILQDAIEIQNAGAFSIVLEMIPEELGDTISRSLHIPTIGIGAGSKTDGQVLVLYDLLGMNPDFNPKFLKKYLNLAESIEDALNLYASQVQTSTFPGKENSF
jgi:3-methyl-2-oxobutanoate hydroxymethyltransferase